MNLDIKKVYIDSRFRTKNSKSETDFSIELPRSFNVPDGVIAHIDDIVIPVSWTTIDERNHNCYIVFACGTALQEANFVFDTRNYDGFTFATALATKLNVAVVGFEVVPTFNCSYDLGENQLTVSISDSRSATVKAATPFYLEFYTDEMLVPRYRTEANTINTIIRNTTQTLITEASPYVCYLDLFNTRNLYLTSSALASYDTVSNFGNDTIIKKIPCGVPYNKLILQSSGSTLDGLDVSKRTLRFIDFKLVDTSFRTIPLQGNHFSFSIVFTQKR